MISNTGVSFNNLEKECNYLDSLQPSKQKPEYWNILGSSKSRTGDQEESSREIIGGILDNSVVMIEQQLFSQMVPVLEILDPVVLELVSFLQE